MQYKVLSGGNLLFTVSGVLKKHPRYLNVSGAGVKQGVATRKRKTAALQKAVGGAELGAHRKLTLLWRSQLRCPDFRLCSDCVT